MTDQRALKGDTRLVIACPSCKSRFNLDGDKIGPAGVKVRCTKCSTLFMVRRPASKTGVPAAKPAPAPAPEPAQDKPDPFGDETRVLSADLAAALQECEDLAVQPEKRPEQTAAPDPMSSQDFAWDEFEPAVKAEAPEPAAPTPAAPAADDDLFKFGDPSVGLDEPMPAPAPQPESAAPDTSAAAGEGAADPLLDFEAPVNAPDAAPAAPAAASALAGAPSGTFDASAAAPGDSNLEQDLFGDLAQELSIDAPPSNAASPAPEPAAAPAPEPAAAPAPEPAAAPAPEPAAGTPSAADLEKDLFGDLAAEFSAAPLAPEPAAAAPAPDAAAAAPAEAGFDAGASAPATAQPPSQSGELAQDLFGDLSIESPSPAPPAAESAPAGTAAPAGFDFDSIDISDGQAAAPAAASGEEVFGGAAAGGSGAQQNSGNLDLDFDAAIQQAAPIPAAPAPAEKKTPSRPGTTFFAQSDEASPERPDWYGRGLAVIGGAAALVLVSLLLFAGDQIDFGQLTGAWLLGEHTVGRADDLVTEDVSAFSYSTISGRSLLVVEGSARNRSQAAVPGARVRATIYDYIGRLVYARSGKLGCSLNPQQVHELERETDLDSVCAEAAPAIAPGETVPFVIVFFDSPVRIARYRYSVDLTATDKPPAPSEPAAPGEPPAEPAETAPAEKAG